MQRTDQWTIAPFPLCANRACQKYQCCHHETPSEGQDDAEQPVADALGVTEGTMCTPSWLTPRELPVRPLASRATSIAQRSSELLTVPFDQPLHTSGDTGL